MYYDHPELFWLVSGVEKDRYQIQEIDDHSGKLRIVFQLNGGAAAESEELEQFEKAADTFMSTIDTGAPAEQTALAIHDQLIDLMAYDRAVVDGSSAAIQSGLRDLGETAYGALVADSSGTPNTATCIGYALAYQYLLHRAGISSSVIEGAAFTENDYLPDLDGHAWNIVQLDGAWYETDACWDDLELSGEQYNTDVINAVMADREHYDNCRHWFYNRTTEAMKQLVPDSSVTFSIPGYQPWCPFTVSSHQRANTEKQSQDSIQIQNFLNRMLPEAAGMADAWTYQ